MPGAARRRRQAVDGRAARSIVRRAIHDARYRDDGRLGPPVRRRLGRAVGRTLPGAVAVLAAAGVARGGFAGPGVGVEAWGSLVLLAAAAPSAPVRAVRRSAEGRRARIGEQLEIGIAAVQGQKILLRISNLSFDFFTLASPGIPMRVVGKDAKLLRGPSGLNLSYATGSIELGGGDSADVILDTAGVVPGTYVLSTTELNHLSNYYQELGGMMTEIVIN